MSTDFQEMKLANDNNDWLTTIADCQEIGKS